ncbi:hypothetical protein, partial [Micromonospora sp. NPDC049679]|uniref:hypothetical protein n=1 Tax=Micromonospora sp. NPDC049679 TaxID=3155920 RepID=UPI0033CF836C
FAFLFFFPSRGPARGPRRPGPGLLATSGRHRPGRPATLTEHKTLKTLGSAQTRPLLGDQGADPLAGHHKGYQPPRTGPRSFGW